MSRAQLHAIARRSKDWQDRRGKRKPDDTEALDRIYMMKRDYISIMLKPDGLTAVKNLAEAF